MAEQVTADQSDFLANARKKYERAADAEQENREHSLDDRKFSRLGEQWPEGVKNDREKDGRPCLVINHHPAFIRQVVNSARQNRPAITVVPADSNADPQTAEIMSGLIRNIEVASDADVAFDTAVESAVAGGFGYFRINIAYTSDDSFDKDISFERIADPLTVFGDPDSESVDGSDWNCAFIVKRLTKDQFAAEYKGKDAVDWDGLGYGDLGEPWVEDDTVMVAEYWHRKQVEKQIVALSNDTVVAVEEYEERADEYAMMGVEPISEPRTVRSHKVTQYIMSGAEVLETVEWPGKYIPIVPVYGEEIVIEGKRHFKSLIRDAKDAQRELNYWRSAAAESVALAPRTPFVGPEGAFDVDPEKWSTANNRNWAFIQYKGQIPPQRQPYVGPPSAELQQAGMAADDMKAIIGLYNPSLGADSAETSGVAIRARQRQGDVGTFHFMDNLVRSIRHAGRILIDLIGKVYTTPRIIRVLGEDMEPQAAAVGPQDMQPQMQMMERFAAYQRIYDLSAGTYDLVVKAGPNYATQREYAQAEIVEIIRAFPDSAAILGPMYLDNSDWPGADKAAEALRAMQGQGEQGQQGPDPQIMAQMQAMQQEMAKLQQQLDDKTVEQQLKAKELQIKAFEAETSRLEKTARAQTDATKAQADVARVAMSAREPSNPFAMEGTR